MRCSNIKFHADIPVPTNSDRYGLPCFCDANGRTYEISAVENACENAKDLPVIRYDSNGEEIVVGVANAKWNKEGFIEVDGVLRHGGTCEEVELSFSKDVMAMRIDAIGFGN